jgi:hypothetical protein
VVNDLPLVDVHNPLHRAFDLEETVPWHGKAEAVRAYSLQEGACHHMMRRSYPARGMF